MSIVAITGLGLINLWGHNEKSVLKSLSKDFMKKENKYFLEMPYDVRSKYRWINECANLGYNASKLALNSGFNHSGISCDRWGVYAATCYGGMPITQQNICDAYLKFGPSGVLPGHSIHSGYHFTADIIAIEQQITGPNITFTSGQLASGLMLLQAFDSIHLDQIDGIIAIGTEFVDPVAENIYEEYDRESAEFLTSGACSLILQNLDTIGNSDIPMGYLLAVEYKSTFTSIGNNQCFAEQLQKVMLDALKKSGKSIEGIDLIISTESGASFEKQCYEIALKEVFPEEILIRTIYPYNTIGYTLGANCIMGLGIGLTCMNSQYNPNRLESKDKKIENILVLAGTPNTAAMAFILTNKV